MSILNYFRAVDDDSGTDSADDSSSGSDSTSTSTTTTTSSHASSDDELPVNADMQLISPPEDLVTPRPHRRSPSYHSNRAEAKGVSEVRLSNRLLRRVSTAPRAAAAHVTLRPDASLHLSDMYCMRESSAARICALRFSPGSGQYLLAASSAGHLTVTEFAAAARMARTRTRRIAEAIQRRRGAVARRRVRSAALDRNWEPVGAWVGGADRRTARTVACSLPLVGSDSDVSDGDASPPLGDCRCCRERCGSVDCLQCAVCPRCGENGGGSHDQMADGSADVHRDSATRGFLSRPQLLSCPLRTVNFGSDYRITGAFWGDAADSSNNFGVYSSNDPCIRLASLDDGRPATQVFGSRDRPLTSTSTTITTSSKTTAPSHLSAYHSRLSAGGVRVSTGRSAAKKQTSKPPLRALLHPGPASRRNPAANVRSVCSATHTSCACPHPGQPCLYRLKGSGDFTAPRPCVHHWMRARVGSPALRRHTPAPHRSIAKVSPGYDCARFCALGGPNARPLLVGAGCKGALLFWDLRTSGTAPVWVRSASDAVRAVARGGCVSSPPPPPPSPPVPSPLVPFLHSAGGGGNRRGGRTAQRTSSRRSLPLDRQSGAPFRSAEQPSGPSHSVLSHPMPSQPGGMSSESVLRTRRHRKKRRRVSRRAAGQSLSDRLLRQQQAAEHSPAADGAGGARVSSSGQPGNEVVCAVPEGYGWRLSSSLLWGRDSTVGGSLLQLGGRMGAGRPADHVAAIFDGHDAQDGSSTHAYICGASGLTYVYDLRIWPPVPLRVIRPSQQPARVVVSSVRAQSRTPAQPKISTPHGHIWRYSAHTDGAGTVAFQRSDFAAGTLNLATGVVSDVAYPECSRTYQLSRPLAAGELIPGTGRVKSSQLGSQALSLQLTAEAGSSAATPRTPAILPAGWGRVWSRGAGRPRRWLVPPPGTSGHSGREVSIISSGVLRPRTKRECSGPVAGASYVVVATHSRRLRMVRWDPGQAVWSLEQRVRTGLQSGELPITVTAHPHMPHLVCGSSLNRLQVLSVSMSRRA